MSSIAYQLSAETLRQQTHLGNYNIFESVRCSSCHKFGHNYLFCFENHTDILLETILQKLLEIQSQTNVIHHFINYLDTFPTGILKKISAYLNIHSKGRMGMKINIYLKLKDIIYDRHNLLLPCLLPMWDLTFRDAPLLFGPENTFPHNNVPAYSLDLYYKSPTYHILGCYQYAANILLKYGNRLTNDPNISLELFTNLLFIDVVKFTYESEYQLLCAMIVEYDENNTPLYFGYTMSYFQILINSGEIYPFSNLPSYFHPSARIERIISTETGITLSQRFQVDIVLQEQLPIANILPIECNILISQQAEEKGNVKRLNEKMEEECSPENKSVLEDDSKEQKKISQEAIEEKEEENYTECPICYTFIHDSNKIMINSCHTYCIDCIMSYLHTNQFKPLKCAMCRKDIHSLLSKDENICLLKNTFQFK